MNHDFLRSLLGQQDEFKRYPKFQYERRIDPFIGFFLPAVLAARYGTAVESLIPEFPVKAHSSRRLSKNIDYMAFDAINKTLTFVELKTDASSVRASQLDYYAEALGTPWTQLLAHVHWVREGSESKHKYDHLLARITDVPPIPSYVAVFLAPDAARSDFEEKRTQAFAKAAGQPTAPWYFLSLREFALTAIATPYPEAWAAVSEALLAIDPVDFPSGAV